MKVLLLHGDVPKDAPADEQDVLVEVAAVRGALEGLGHETAALPLTLDLEGAARGVKRFGPELVFNLVESVAGRGSLIHLAPALLDSLGVAYTGSGTQAVFVTSNKVIAKRLMRAAGIPTPDWHTKDGLARGRFGHPSGGNVPAPWLVKSVWEHASVGLDEGSVVVPAGPAGLKWEMERREGALGGECFAEAYVEGREINVSLLEADSTPSVLPPSEICFDGFPEGRYKIVDYRAKWDEGSVEYASTTRRFLTGATGSDDGALTERLAAIALKCWELFGLSGYARVDFRLDGSGRPWVLEVNVNPCVSPDSGFVASAAAGGLMYDELVSKIAGASLRAAAPGGIRK